jgi:hypothetical protein
MSKPITFISGILMCLLLGNSVDIHAQSSKIANPAITEVYGSYAPKLTPEQTTWLNSQLDRSEVKKLDRKADEKITLLSTVPLITKYVSNLQPDNFNQPQKINALKYAINFAGAEDQTFRIDGTDYVLFVKGKK